MLMMLRGGGMQLLAGDIWDFLELLATLRYLGGAMGIAFGKILWRCIAKIAGW